MKGQHHSKVIQLLLLLLFSTISLVVLVNIGSKLFSTWHIKKKLCWINEWIFFTTNDSLVENQTLNWGITNGFIRYDCKIKDWKNHIYHLRNQTRLKQRDDFFNIIILSHKFTDWIMYFITGVYLSKSAITCATCNRIQLRYQRELYWKIIWGQKSFH